MTYPGQVVERSELTNLALASPTLADAVARHPGLMDDSENGSVSLRLQGLLARTLVGELSGSLDLKEATATLSDGFDHIVAAELKSVRVTVADQHPEAADIAFAVIAMGKWGAREINYYSDIDLVFVHRAPSDEPGYRKAALAIASTLISRLSAPTFDGKAFNVDADLRPEGAMGPLSRSLDSYRTYYERWAEPWELQALLKSRPVAGDQGLADEFANMANQVVWEVGLTQEALRGIRQLKAMAESAASPSDLKRGRGGIRDIEFSVQLLQLVHGRFDADLRVPSTLDALDALAKHGYIDAEEASSLGDAYRFMRRVEHLLQVYDLRQSHILPTDQADKERLGRLLGFEVDPAKEFQDHLARVRNEARDLHERLYFRPILDSLVGVSDRLEPADVEIRMEALGFQNVAQATDTVVQLTKGLSRRSRVMHQTLPLMLDWLSRSPDPDIGLHQLGLLLARKNDHSALITLLQHNPLAGERLCTLLGTGALLGELIDRIPEFVPRLADDTTIAAVRDGDGAWNRLSGLLDSRPTPDERIGTIRRFVRRRKLRIAARDILGDATPEATLRSLSDSADAAIKGALRTVSGQDDLFGVVAMGKWGGHELSYGSDIDLMYVHGGGTRDRSLEIAGGLQAVLAEPSRHGEAYSLDADLRPEGRKGPLSRSLKSFRTYYEKWVEPWELLALVKARPVAGSQVILDQFFALVEEVIWSRPLSAAALTGIRTVKARVESERIPVDEDPDFHLKLGPGSLSDIEFATQTLQLIHGPESPDLRVTGTLEALSMLHAQSVIGNADYAALTEAYLFCTRVRLRLHLQSGQPSDSLPTDPAAASRLAASLGMARTADLREEYRRYTRRARRSFEKLFYE